MKRLLMMAVIGGAVCATLVMADCASAQIDGYRFGVGIQQSRVNGHFGRSRTFGPFMSRGFDRAEPPYFALHPPVYYSEQIVRRPYGISPFAAPAGIIPAEMQVPPTPVRILNPHVLPFETVPKPEEPKKDGEKST
jgi:hypothetical protein